MDIFSVAHTRVQLPLALEGWQAQGSLGNRKNIGVFVVLVYDIDSELSVQAGHFVQVQMREKPLLPSAPLRPRDPDQAVWTRLREFIEGDDEARNQDAAFRRYSDKPRDFAHCLGKVDRIETR